MKEAVPNINSDEIKSILYQTALPLRGISTEKQGLGRINPFYAVTLAIEKSKGKKIILSPQKMKKSSSKKTYRINYVSDNKKDEVFMAGSFNDWKLHPMRFSTKKENHFYYEIEIGEERIEYKFKIGDTWIFDKLNPIRSKDGYGGFNSVLLPHIFN